MRSEPQAPQAEASSNSARFFQQAKDVATYMKDNAGKPYIPAVDAGYMPPKVPLAGVMRAMKPSTPSA